MARVGVVGRVISNFMGSTSSRLEDSMKLALLVLLCNFLCSFSVVVAFITDDLRRLIDKANNNSRPSAPMDQTGTLYDSVIPLYNVSSAEGQKLFEDYINNMKPRPPPPNQSADTSIHLSDIIDNRTLSKEKPMNPPSVSTSHHLLASSTVSVPVFGSSRLPHTWITPIPKPHFKTGITISAQTPSPDTLLSTSNKSSMETAPSSSAVDVTLIDGQNSSDHQGLNLTLDYTMDLPLANLTIGCNATVEYFITQRAADRDPAAYLEQWAKTK